MFYTALSRVFVDVIKQADRLFVLYTSMVSINGNAKNCTNNLMSDFDQYN